MIHLKADEKGRMKFPGNWIEIEKKMLSEVIQAQNENHSRFSLKCGLSPFMAYIFVFLLECWKWIGK